MKRKKTLADVPFTRFSDVPCRLPMMAAFDALPFAESCDRRSSTTTPLQALSLMNGELIQEESEFVAKRIEREAGPRLGGADRSCLQFDSEPDPTADGACAV